MTIPEVAARMGVTARTVQRWVSAGHLESRLLADDGTWVRDVTIGMVHDFERSLYFDVSLAYQRVVHRGVG